MNHSYSLYQLLDRYKSKMARVAAVYEDVDLKDRHLVHVSFKVQPRAPAMYAQLKN